MSDESNAFENTIAGVTGLESVRNPGGYEHVRVFQGRFETDSRSRPITLRTLPDHSTDSAVDDRFLSVCRNWRNVATHPNVVELIEWGDTPRPWAIVDDEYETRLSELGGEQSATELFEPISEIAKALRNAALYNVTHLNLRPEYIRLSEGNEVRQVDDWGLQRSIVEGHETEYITPYTAPEQLDQSLGSQGERTDVYALAGLAYFALTGVPPKTATRHSVLHEEPVPASDAVETVPDDVETLLNRGLSKHPAARPDSPFVFSDQFKQAANLTQEPLATGGTTGSDTRVRDARTAPRNGSTVSRSGSEGVLDSFPPETLSRRRGVLKTAGGILLLAGVGAVVNQYLFADQVDPVLVSVPSTVDFVMHAESEQLLSDDDIERTVTRQLSGHVESMEVTTLDGAIDHVLPGLQLNAQEVHEVIAFGATTESPSQYLGLILRTEWDSQRAANALAQSDASTNRMRYREHTVYAVDSDRLPWTVLIGFLGNNEFVIGTRPEVENVIDQYRSEDGTPSQEVSRAFESATQGAVRFGFDVSETVLTRINREELSTLASNIESGYGSVGTDSDRPVVLTFRADSTSAAEELEGQLDAVFLLLRDRAGELPIDGDSELQKKLRQLIDDTNLIREETEVSIIFPDGLDLVSLTLSLLLQVPL